MVVRPDSNVDYRYTLDCAGATGVSAQGTALLRGRFMTSSTCSWSYLGGYWTRTGGALTLLGEYLPQNNAFWQWEAVGKYMTSCMKIELHGASVSGSWNWSVPTDTTATVF